MSTVVLFWTQIGLLVPLAVLGFHRGWMALLYLTHRRQLQVAPLDDDELPAVTVQLPIYNERFVAGRLLQAVAALDYPRSRLEIQVLDDSSDDTGAIVEAALARLPADLRVRHLRRHDRIGYKAGALAAGLQQASGELIAVFDADFVPPPDFLRATVPSFADAGVGMVQTRWDHLNAGASWLTRVQALLLDGHFVVEHTARARSGRFFNFNGTAGVFRRRCIETAGGWQADTLTEDLDLSYRAQLAGWSFLYRPDLACPAELPLDTNAFLNQQHRWAKGSMQTARKLLGRIWRAPIAWRVKLESTFHLGGNIAFVLLLALILVGLPLQLSLVFGDASEAPTIDLLSGLPLLASTLSVLLYYGLAQLGLRRLSLATLLRLPLVIAIGAGLCVNNSAALLAGLRAETGVFRRTPKSVRARGADIDHDYRARRGCLPLLELGLGLWAAITALLATRIDLMWTAVFHGWFAFGLLWIGSQSLLSESRARVAVSVPSPS